MKDNDQEILFKKFKILSCYKKNEHSAVYLANHIFLEKKVFLKVLNTSTIPETNIIERFKREAKILAKLEHSNIIKVFDFGMFDNYFYISFEYFESVNLRELLSKKELSNDIKKSIFIQLVKSLNYAHQNNVIHRDLKPENILISEDFSVKLTDFGLAHDSIDNLITQKYSVVGTPAYMSPEQIEGNNLTLKSDLFSLGIILAELFSGTNPFIGNSSNESINNIISFNDTISDNILKHQPPELKSILIGLLKKNPDQRFNSCFEILALLNVKTETIISKRRVKNKKLLYSSMFIISIVFFGIIYTLFNQNKSDFENLSENSAQLNDIIDTSKGRDLVNKNEITNIKSEPNDLLISEEPDVISADKEVKIETTELQPNKIEKEKSVEKGNLFVKCFPWAKIYLDGKFIETTPLSKNIELNTGKYQVTLSHPDYPEYSDSITVTANNLEFVEVNLDTLFGHFICQVYPWSDLIINGTKIATTPLSNSIRLNEGLYKLRLENPKYEPMEIPIKIVRNDTLQMRFNLENGKIY